MKKSIAAFSLSLSVFSASGVPVYAQQHKPATSKPVVVVTEMKQTPAGAASSAREENGNSRQQKPITNADIIRMVKAGFGESVVINHIQTNETRFDVSLNGLFELKNSGVSQKIIEAMQFVAAAQAGESRQPAQKASNQSSATDQSLSKQPQTASMPDFRAAAAINTLPPSAYGMQFYAYLIQAGDKQLLHPTVPQTVQTKEKTGDLASIAKDAAVTEAISHATTAVISAAGTAAATSSIPIFGGIIQGGIMAGNLLRRKPTATYVTAIGGQSSSVVPRSGNPKFEVVYGNVAGVNPDEYEPEIVKLIPTENNWRLVYAKKAKQGYPAVEGKFYSEFSEIRVASRSTKLGRGDVQIEAEKPLEPGEYAVVLRPVSQTKTYSMKETGDFAGYTLTLAVWDFTIKNPSGATQNPAAAPIPQAAIQASAIQSQRDGQISRKPQAENAQPVMTATIPSRSSSGATIGINGSYDRAFEAALNFLKKQGNTIESASRETGQISTAMTVSGGYQQTGSRMQLTFIKEGDTSLTVRVAVIEQKRYKALKTEPWGEAKVNREKSGKAADEILLILNAAQ